MSGIKIKELNLSLDVSSLLEMLLRLIIEKIATAYSVKQSDHGGLPKVRDIQTHAIKTEG